MTGSEFIHLTTCLSNIHSTLCPPLCPSPPNLSKYRHSGVNYLVKTSLLKSLSLRTTETPCHMCPPDFVLDAEFT